MKSIFCYNRLQYRLSLWSVIGFLSFFLVAGCITLKRHDISNDSLYKKYIGNVYKTKKKMVIFGVRYEISEDKIKYYEIMPLPGVSGPEIVPLGNLPAGTILEITKVIRRSPSLFLRLDIVLVAKFIGGYSFEGREVDIAAAHGIYTKTPKDDLYVLSPEHFEKINDH